MWPCFLLTVSMCAFLYIFSRNLSGWNLQHVAFSVTQVGLGPFVSEPSGQQEGERGQQAECRLSPPEGSSGLSTVTQVCVTAHVGVVEVDACCVFLPAPSTLGRDGTALLIQTELHCASSSHRSTSQAALPSWTFLRKLQTVHWRDGRKHTRVTAQTHCQR